MIYVGRFSEEDMISKIDKIKVQEAMDKHNLKYTNTKLVKKSGKIIGLDIWICNANEIDLKLK